MTSQPASKTSDAESLEALAVASALIKARTERGLTQAQLSEASGISRSAIKGYETGRNMPGSRELKALCRVLHITPNALLFGTETPFSGEPADAEDVRLLREALAEPEDAVVRRARLATMLALLTPGEVGSLLSIVQALAVARHGAEVVQQSILGADFLLGMQRSMLAEAKKGPDGGPPDAQAIADEAEAFMERQGHTSKKP